MINTIRLFNERGHELYNKVMILIYNLAHSSVLSRRKVSPVPQ